MRKPKSKSADDMYLSIIASLLVDAERYRWIRLAGAWESEIGMDKLSENPADFDAAVDERILIDRGKLYAKRGLVP